MIQFVKCGFRRARKIKTNVQNIDPLVIVTHEFAKFNTFGVKM